MIYPTNAGRQDDQMKPNSTLYSFMEQFKYIYYIYKNINLNLIAKIVLNYNKPNIKNRRIYIYMIYIYYIIYCIILYKLYIA